MILMSLQHSPNYQSINGVRVIRIIQRYIIKIQRVHNDIISQALENTSLWSFKSYDLT